MAGHLGWCFCLSVFAIISDAARKILVANSLDAVTIISLEQIPVNKTHGSKDIQTTNVS